MSVQLAPRPKNEERRVAAVKRTGIIDSDQSENFSVFCEIAKALAISQNTEKFSDWSLSIIPVLLTAATRLSSFLGLGASCTDIFLPPSKIEH